MGAKQTDQTMHAEIASTSGMDPARAAPADYAAAVQRIAELEAELGVSEGKRSAAEKAAIAAAEGQGMLQQSEIREIPTGVMAKVQRCIGYESNGHNGNHEVLKPIFKTVEIPTFAYKIVLAP